MEKPNSSPPFPPTDPTLAALEARAVELEAKLAESPNRRPPIRGEDISITVIKDGFPVETVGLVKSIDIEFKMDLAENDYLGASDSPAPIDFGAVTFTMTSKPDAAFWESLAAKLAPKIKRRRAEVIEHMLRGGLFLHPVGFLARIYVSRTLTGAWLVRARGASLHGEGPWVCARVRCRTRALAMAAARRLLVPLMIVPGEDRPIDAVPLFAERDGSRIETVAGPVLFPSEVKCQVCKRRGAVACAYKCGAVLCAGCGAEHQPPDCPPQMAEYAESMRDDDLARRIYVGTNEDGVSFYRYPEPDGEVEP